MDAKTIWIGWRRDIFRFLAVCAGALVLGLMINRVVAVTRHRISPDIPRGVEGLVGALDADFLSGPRTTAQTWTHRQVIAPGRTLWIRDMNGSIAVSPAAGESLSIKAVKTFGHSSPDSVHMVTVPVEGGGVAICAVWTGAGGSCGPGDTYNQKHIRHDDVAVEFTIRLPKGVRIDASTVNGGVQIVGAQAAASASTIDGAVSVETSRGPVHGTTINGNVRAVIRGSQDSGAVHLTTVNGGITLELPAEADATIEARTLNGSIDSDFPLEVSGKFVGHHASGAIGHGGREIELRSVNGEIRLRKAAAQSSR